MESPPSSASHSRQSRGHRGGAGEANLGRGISISCPPTRAHHDPAIRGTLQSTVDFSHGPRRLELTTDLDMVIISILGGFIQRTCSSLRQSPFWKVSQESSISFKKASSPSPSSWSRSGRIKQEQDFYLRLPAILLLLVWRGNRLGSSHVPSPSLGRHPLWKMCAKCEQTEKY